MSTVTSRFSFVFGFLSILLILVGCNTRVKDLTFQVDGTREFDLYYPGNFITGTQDDIYLLSQSVSLGSEAYFFVEIPLGGSRNPEQTVTIETFSGAMTAEGLYESPLTRHQFVLPFVGDNEIRSYRMLFQPFREDEELPAGGVNIQAFRISSSDIPILAIGLLESRGDTSTIEFSESRVTIYEGSTYSHTLITYPNSGQITSILDFSFDPTKGTEVFLEYEFFPPANRMTIVPGEIPSIPRAELIFIEASGGDVQTFLTEMRLHPGSQRVVIPATTHGIRPSSIEIRNTEPGFSLRSISVRTWKQELRGDEHLDPLASEFGSILRYPITAWRDSKYEVFSWTIHPEILVIDFRDRDTQKRFLDRLAFFVEKRGFTGTLLTNSQLEGRHAWNAHNYRGQGLADFYNAAQASSFPLNPEEVELRDLVARWGIITRSNDDVPWVAGRGGIISLTRDPRESGASRSLFLTHEGLHGIYYMNPKLVAQAQAEWQNLSADVRRYLTRYFGYLQYETRDLYLMENEFQAYMLQQPLQEVRWVFGTLYRGRLIRAYPEEEAFFRTTAPLAASEFFNAAFRLQSLVFEEYGLLGGNLHSLVPGN